MTHKTNTFAAKTTSSEHATSKWLYINVGLAIVLILAGVVSLLWMEQQASSPAGSQPAAVVPAQGAAPDFTLTALDGETVNLSDYAGQVVLVNTWATWCPPCKAEMPTIDEYYQAHKDEGFVVLAVNSQEQAPVVDQFIRANGFTFPVLLDTDARVLEQYNIRGLPTSIIIGRDGAIKYTHTGEITRRQLDQLIGPLL